MAQQNPVTVNDAAANKIVNSSYFDIDELEGLSESHQPSFDSTVEENHSIQPDIDVIESSAHSEPQAVSQPFMSQPAITSPEENPIESFQKHTAILHDTSKSQHSKIYNRAAASIDLPADDYTE